MKKQLRIIIIIVHIYVYILWYFFYIREKNNWRRRYDKYVLLSCYYYIHVYWITYFSTSNFQVLSIDAYFDAILVYEIWDIRTYFT